MNQNPVVDRWSTDELSLAAYLAVMFNVDPACQWDGASCYFLFDRSQDLLDEVSRFVGGEARVEPKEYHIRASHIRKNMFSSKASR